MPISICSSLFIDNRTLRLVRIEDLLLLEFVKRAQPKIFLAADILIAGDEGLHVSHAVFGSRSYQREAADQHAFQRLVHPA
jgi:hypothetical protein